MPSPDHYRTIQELEAESKATRRAMAAAKVPLPPSTLPKVPPKLVTWAEEQEFLERTKYQDPGGDITLPDITKDTP